MENKTKLKNERAGHLLIVIVILIASLLLFGLTVIFFGKENSSPVYLPVNLKDKNEEEKPSSENQSIPSSVKQDGLVLNSSDSLRNFSSDPWQGKSITDRYIASAKKWNKAYSWGDHSKAGYIENANDVVDGQELDGVFSTMGLLERVGTGIYKTIENGVEGQFLSIVGGTPIWSNLPAVNSHNSVSLSGALDYLTLSGQEITLNSIDLTSDVVGILPIANLNGSIMFENEKISLLNNDANYITDGNTDWDNSYGFITSADDSVSGTELDGVFSTTGLLKRTGTGIYTTVTDDSSNWGDAYTYRLTSATGSGPLTLTLLNNSLSGSISQANSSTDGYLSSTNFQDFSSKQAGSTNLSSLSGLAYSAGAFVRMTGTNTFALDTTAYQALLTNPVTGTGTANKIAKFTGTSSLGDSQISDDGINVGIGTDTPNSKFQTTGSISSDYQIVTNNTTLNENHHTVEVNSPANTITLPSAVNIKGREYIIKNYSNSAVTIATSSSQTIDGKNSWTLNDKESLIIVSDNANWKTVGNYNSGGLFVGLTTSATNGAFVSGTDTGYKAGNALCNAQYPDSHMCRTDEIINTIKNGSLPNKNNTPSLPDGAWIAEGPPGYISESNDCDGYTNNTSLYLGPLWIFGLNNDNSGRGRLTNCFNSNKIACCR